MKSLIMNLEEQVTFWKSQSQNWHDQYLDQKALTADYKLMFDEERYLKNFYKNALEDVIWCDEQKKGNLKENIRELADDMV